MSGAPFKAVVFDLDGTLIDTERYYHAAFQAVARAFGVVVTPDLYAALVGIATSERHSILRRTFGPSFPVDDFIAAYYAERAARLPARIPVCPGAATVLRGLRLPKAIATSASRRTALAHMERAELSGHFQHVATRDDVRHGKPAPDTYLMAADLLGLAPAECLAIEDSPNGVAAAHAAGMNVVMIAGCVDPHTRRLCLAVVSRIDAIEDLLVAALPRNHLQGSYVGWAGDTGQRPVTERA